MLGKKKKRMVLGLAGGTGSSQKGHGTSKETGKVGDVWRSRRFTDVGHNRHSGHTVKLTIDTGF